jgi:hypothetical protein
MADQDTELAGRLLRVEQQLLAYEKLHADELDELWRTLNDCKRRVTALVQDPKPSIRVISDVEKPDHGER